MKHDKKTQRSAVLARVAANRNLEEEDDDIVRNMTNLILHKQEQFNLPWEKNLLELDTATNSNVTNVMRASTSKRQPF